MLLVSEAETALFCRLVPDAPVHTVTNGVNLDYFRPGNDPVRDDSCVFVGALDYHPNVDAVCWFGNRAILTISRPLALRPCLTTGLPFSFWDRIGTRAGKMSDF